MPCMVKVMLELEGRDDDVVSTAVMILLLTEQVAEETVLPMIEAEQRGVPIVKSVGNDNFNAALLPKDCPSRKLNVYVEAETIEVEESTRVALELLKVLAEAAIVALSCKYSSELRLKINERVVGVSEEGRRKEEQ